MNCDKNKSPRILQVWLVPLDASSVWCVEALRHILSSVEQRRLDALRMNDDRVRFVASHALTRVALSQLYPIPPKDWKFDYTNLGKPFVAAPQDRGSFHFSLSHTGGLVGCAIAETPVGLDLELWDRDLDVDKLLPAMMAPQEFAQWPLCLAENRVRRFLSLWTVKEALSKALGVGMHTPFSEFAIDLGVDGTAKIISMPHSLGDASLWNLRQFELKGTHVGALADSEPEEVTEVSMTWLDLHELAL